MNTLTFREHVLLIVLTLLVMLKFNLWLFAP